MGRHRFLVCVASLVALVAAQGSTSAAAAGTTDYPPAKWIPASAANYSVANRTHDYPIDMIVIHDIEGSYESAIQIFQDPDRAASAHYVIGDDGEIAQMVLEKNIAWHAGNWDYNTRAIGIEHEGFASANLYTTAEYKASALLIASICSRWGVPMDRAHVIGHYQVPDPNNPALFGGSDHHTDPGRYWNWSYYMGLAVADAKLLPSPPHMVLSATAVGHDRSVALSWPAARTCRTPIDHYQVVEQPDNVTTTVPGTATATTIPGLTNGKTYLFTVTAVNADGQDTLVSNHVVPFTVPDALTTPVSAVAAGESAAVSWAAAPYDEGAWITGYVVTPYLDGVAQSSITFNQRNTLEVVLNLKDNHNYMFTVAAKNAAGTGPPSAMSNSVTPSATLREAPSQVAPASPSPGTGPIQSSPAPTPTPR